jgi:Peptidase family M23
MAMTPVRKFVIAVGGFALVTATLLWSSPASSADEPGGATDPYITDEIVRDITFPILGESNYVDTYLAARSGGRKHLGVDMMSDKGNVVVAAVDSCVTWLRYAGEGSDGTNLLIMEDENGWEYRYIHLNNDSPGTDDAANRRDEAFYEGIDIGDCVEAGDPIAFIGDSGAEWAGGHLHFEIRNPTHAINPYFSVKAAEGDKVCGVNSNPQANPSEESAAGYWILGEDGTVEAVNAPHYGDLTTIEGAANPVSMQSTRTGKGYWIVDSAGVVHAFGDAENYGDMSDFTLVGEILRIEPTPSGDGYWLVAEDGGIFAFGAPFLGSMGGTRLNSPVISMSSNAKGDGYFLVAGDGGVFALGDAEFRGSTGDIDLAAPVLSLAVDPADKGYWLYAADGGVFSYGVEFYGSVPGMGICNTERTVALRVTDTGNGYWVLGEGGTVYPFGDAYDFGSASSLGGEHAIDLAVQHLAPVEANA